MKRSIGRAAWESFVDLGITVVYATIAGLLIVGVVRDRRRAGVAFRCGALRDAAAGGPSWCLSRSMSWPSAVPRARAGATSPSVDHDHATYGPSRS